MDAKDELRPQPISVKVPEAVRLTGLSRSRIYELMRSGDIEFAKVGSSTLILVESLRGFILRRRSPQGPTTAPIDGSDKVPAGKLPTGGRSSPHERDG